MSPSATRCWRWQLDEAERNFGRALDLEPSDTIAHLGLADLLSWTGRTQEAAEEIRRGRSLDPFDPGMNMNVGDMLYFDGRFDAALAQFEDTIEMAPHLPRLYMRTARACRALGDFDRAARAPALGVEPSFAPLKSDPRCAELHKRIGVESAG